MSGTSFVAEGAWCPERSRWGVAELLEEHSGHAYQGGRAVRGGGPSVVFVAGWGGRVSQAWAWGWEVPGALARWVLAAAVVDGNERSEGDVAGAAAGAAKALAGPLEVEMVHGAVEGEEER